MKSEAFTAGYRAHQDGRMRVPALDPWVMPAIVATGNASGAVTRLLDDWLKWWDTHHFEDQTDFETAESMK